MSTAFAHKPTLGKGIFTPAEIARFLQLPTSTINRWINTYWDGEFAFGLDHGASWKIDGSKAVDFLTMIEIVVMGTISEQGVRSREIAKAHKVLSDIYKTSHPFASRSVINRLKIDGKRIYFVDGDHIINLDGTHQINLDFIKDLFKNLDFDTDELATRYWPLGKDKSIVVDPKRKFGHPVIAGKNIYPETIFGMIEAGDSPAFIASLYDLSDKEVQDAINYCSAA